MAAKKEVTFTAVGFARKENKLKIRFTNDLQKRLYRLKRDSQTAIEMFELTRAMSKLEAAKFLAKKAPEGPKRDAAIHLVEKLSGETPVAKKTQAKKAPAKKVAQARKAVKPAKTEVPVHEAATQAA